MCSCLIFMALLFSRFLIYVTGKNRYVQVPYADYTKSRVAGVAKPGQRRKVEGLVP